MQAQFHSCVCSGIAGRHLMGVVYWYVCVRLSNYACPWRGGTFGRYPPGVFPEQLCFQFQFQFQFPVVFPKRQAESGSLAPSGLLPRSPRPPVVLWSAAARRPRRGPAAAVPRGPPASPRGGRCAFPAGPPK